MEIIVAFGVIAFVVWIIAQTRRQPSVRRQSRVNQPPTRTSAEVSATDAIVKGTRSASAAECWVPAGREAKVAGYTIQGGMLYIGQGLSSITGLRVEPALIDPSLPVERSSPDRSGSAMTYWPSYSTISPACRAAYLDWLSAGRRDPTAYIGYVFLYFYGLERCALAEAPRSDRAKEELPAISSEVEQLLEVYGGNGSFRRYATQLLDVLRMLATGGDEIKPPTDRTGYELPVSLRIGIGRIVAQGRPLPPDWALSWFLVHPETSLRTAARRCPEEFSELFRARYAREFGDGLVLRPNRSQLRMAVTPASASFGGQVELSMNLPDVAALTGPLSKLRRIGESCEADLDPFSRWVGRNVDAPRTIAAVALLPSELATTHASEEARGLWAWVEETVGSHERAVGQADDLLRHCASFGSGKLAKSEAVLLAQLLEKGGYGIEPDVRFGGVPLAPGGTAVLFRLPPSAAAIASPHYAAATVLLHLAVAVCTADGSISQSEQQHLEQHLRRALALTDAERVRLSGHLAWLLKSPPSLTGLKRRLEPLDQGQRSAIADFIIAVAGADGQISPDEIRTLGRIYPMLGLDVDEVYSHVHAMTAGAAAAIDGGEPTAVISAQPSTGYPIPSRPEATQSVQLDMTAVKAKLAESAEISAILSDIFTEDEPEGVPAPTISGASSGKVSPAHATLLSRLAERPEWSRSEFEAIAAECHVLPDGAIDGVNEAAFEHTGAPVLEGEDPIHVDAAAARELLT